MSAEIASAWLKLAKEAQPQGVTRLRVSPGAPVDLFVGIENPGSIRVLIAEAPRSSFRLRRWIACVGFTSHRAPAQAPGRDMLVIRLNEPGATDIFTALVTDVVAVATSGQPADVLERIAGRLERWQRFLEQRGTSELSVHEQCGLYGELWFLENVLMPGAGLVAAVNAWSGPAASNQDFQLARTCIEVKATLAGTRDEIRISNVRQLDETGIEALFLVHLRLESRHGSGDTLPAIIDRIRVSLGEQVSAFNDRLTDAGYLDGHRALYERSGYGLRQRSNFRVHGNFPRIRGGSLLPGVTDVAYSISLAACMPHAVPDDQIESILEES